MSILQSILRNTFKKFLNKSITPLSLSTLHSLSFNINDKNIFLTINLLNKNF